ncbi:MAG: diguanylate cyclase [Eubacterium sp.]|nr:diguanylate cyclase [Eubacterium sp.]
MSMSMTYAILYLELNLASVIIVGIVYHKTTGISKMVAQRNFVMAILAEIVFFLSDTAFVLSVRGIIPYSRTIVMIEKSIYFFSTTIMCFFWFVYFEYMQESPFVQNRKRVLWSSSLVWIMGILLVINIFTGILFYVDGSGVYTRGPLFLVQYFLSYVYVVFSCTRALVGIFDKKKISKRRVLISLAHFPIAPAAAGILQFIYPGLPLACVALSLSTLVLYLNWVDTMISVDPLTKLSNRKMLSFFFNHWLTNESEPADLYLMILDANKFKSINDTYGHLEGDAALIRIAEALTIGCRAHKKRTNIIRYGGDEFMILVWANDISAINLLKTSIATELERLNREAAVPYDLTLSVGVAKATSSISLKDLVAKADEELYKEKEKLKGQSL